MFYEYDFTLECTCEYIRQKKNFYSLILFLRLQRNMSRDKYISQLRVVTLNVHFFTDINEQSNVHQLARLLKPMSIDILALQEVLHTNRDAHIAPERHYHLKLLSDLLELPYIAFCETVFEFGNALLSKFPMKNSTNYYADVGENLYKRGMLAVQIEHEFFRENNATFYVTHLDQIYEHARLKQIEQFEKYIQQNDNLQLIMGDMNSLTFSDYSDDYFRIYIDDIRQKNNWERPFELVTNQLKAYGFTDCWREMNNEAINDQAVTCIYKTRIDYIWKRGELKNQWEINECRIFSSENATDHNGVLISFTKTH